MMISYSNTQPFSAFLQIPSFTTPQIKTKILPLKSIVKSNLYDESGDDNIRETFFISHGRSRISIEDSKPARKFLESWQQKVYSKKPKAILVISAHWETDQPTVNSVTVNDTIFGHFAFPARIKQFRYPAPGCPDLAKRAHELLTASGFESVHIDKEHGLDHGVWIPLMFMYPEPDIPIFQLAVQPHLDGTHHYNMGRALAPLKDEGVLIIGSGSATHPADDTPHSLDRVAPWAAEFDHWLESALTNRRYAEVNECETKAPNWKLAHPWPEHMYPLHVAMGAAGEDWKAELIHKSWDHGTMSYSSYKFTSN